MQIIIRAADFYPTPSNEKPAAKPNRLFRHTIEVLCFCFAYIDRKHAGRVCENISDTSCVDDLKNNLKIKDKNNFAGLAPPSRYFTFASPKESTQRKGDPQRVEFPPQPHRPGRGRNLRRASVAPLRTADRLRP
ncbi:hypothetical protein [Aquitalea denitrificans]|uniref:hypothetical protein n=1 Tax=Aquitalea denitrificans TaxID=519081 RepID=UPI00135AAA26|nr:hypothetical protein [Aquitalea denitrificans]